MRTLLMLILIVLITGCAKSNEVIQIGNLKLTSPAFGHNGKIPDKYTCQGVNVNPPLEISGIPDGAKSLVLIVDDPDAPAGTWDHWLIWNLPLIPQIEENSIPEGAVQGLNDFTRYEYKGPCPPSGTHRYFFKLYALDTTLSLHSDAAKQDVENAMEGHIVAQTQLIGIYAKK